VSTEWGARHLQTPVRDQGTRSTCTAFAVSAAHEWQASLSVRSVEDVLWSAHEEGAAPSSEAIYVQEALQGLEVHEHASEQAWPYGTPAWPADRPAAAHEADSRAKLPAWRELAGLTPEGIRAEMRADRAVILSLRVVPPAWFSLQAALSGVVDAARDAKSVGAHAVLAVGGFARNGEEGIVAKNSWGPTWGDGGYALLTDQYIEHFTDAAHVLDAA
jgi:hypothetical protein